MTPDENNGWAEYQRLVLAELERHNKWLVTIDEKLNSTLMTFKLEKQMIEHLANIVGKLDQRVHTLEQAHTETEAIEEYRAKNVAARKWVVGLSITSILSIAALIVDVVIR